MQPVVVLLFKYRDRGPFFHQGKKILTQYVASVLPLDDSAEEEKVRIFLDRFPEHAKTLRLAVVHEESGEGEMNYRGWQWTDVEVHPTKLMRLVIEGISKVNIKTRHSTHYLLRDRSSVKKALNPPARF